MSSSVSGTTSTPTMQIYGIASGLDTASIIKATMAAYTQPMLPLQTEMDNLQFTRQVFSDVNTELGKLEQISLNLRMEATFRSKLVTSSNNAIVTAVAQPEAQHGSHTIKVNQVAQAAEVFGDVVTAYRRTDVDDTAGVSQVGGTAHGTAQGTHSLNVTSGYAGRLFGWVQGMDLDRTLASFGATTMDGFTITAGGQSMTIAGLTDKSTVRDLVQHINQGGTGVTAEVRNGRLALTANVGGVDLAISDASGNYSNSIAAKLFGATDQRVSTAQIIGGRQVQATQTLGSLGVATANRLAFIVGGVRTTVGGLTAASTVSDLASAINAQVAGVNAQVANGSLVISANAVGTSIELLDANYSDDIASQVLGLAGRQDTQAGAVNAGVVVSRASSGARIVGGVAGVALNAPLSSFGITTPNGLTVTGDGGSSFTVSGLTGASSVGDLVSAINSGSTSVRASVIGGRLTFISADGGVDFTVSDVDETQNGVASRLLGLVSSGAVPGSIIQSTSGAGFGTATVGAAQAGKSGAVIGQVPTAGAIVGTNTLGSYGLLDADVTAFSVRVGTVTTNVGMTSATQTINDLVKAIDAVNGVRARIDDGRLVVEAEKGNADFALVDQNYTTDVARVIFGQTAERGSTAEITGKAHAAPLTGATILSTLGVTSATGLAFSIAGGAGITITGLTGASTVQNLIDRINAQVTAVTAHLTDDGRLAITAKSPHVNFAIADSNYSGTIAGEVLGLTRVQRTLDSASGDLAVNAGATGAAIVGPQLTGNLTDTLNTFGVTTTAGEFSFSYRGSTQAVAVTGTMTLQQLIDNINALDGIRANFVGGRLVIGAKDPRDNFTVSATKTTYNAGNGFRELLGVTASQATDAAATSTGTVTAASTGDYTVNDLVIPLAGGNPEFHAEVGREGSTLTTLFDGGTIQGTGVNLSLTRGQSNLFTTAELSAGVATASLVEGSQWAGQRQSFTLAKSGSPAGTPLSFVGNSVYEGAVSGTYYIRFVSPTQYVVEDAGGHALGAAVNDGAKFAAYADGPLAGSTFTFTSNGAAPPPPATGDRWSFVLGVDTSKTLAQAGFAKPASTSTNGTFTINGKSITISDYTSETVESVLAKINSSGAGVIATYDAYADRFLVSSVTLGSNSQITMGSMNDSSNFLSIAKMDLQPATSGGTGTQRVGSDNNAVTTSALLSQGGFSTAITAGTFTINGVKLYVDPSKDTLDDLLKRISDSPAHVVAKYDATNDRIVIENNMDDPATHSNTIRVRVGSPTDTSNFLVATRVLDTTETGPERTVGTAGKDANFVVDGLTYTRTKNTVDDVIPSVTLTLHSAKDEEATINLDVDVDRATGAIADWLAEWNKVVNLLTPDALTKDQQQYLTPLTTAKQNTMTLAEIDQYNSLSKQYRTQEVIRTDETLRRFFDTLRQATTDPVKGLPDAFNALGDVKLDPYTPTGKLVPKGHLVLDSENKDDILQRLKDNATLQTALSDNEQDMLSLFGAQAYAGSGTTAVTDPVVNATTGLLMPSGGTSLQFRVGDGTHNSGVVSLAPGQRYTQSQILDLLDNAGLNVGAKDHVANIVGVTASVTSSGSLQFSLTNSDPSGAVWFQDLSTGTNTLQTILGIKVADNGPGVARFMDDSIGKAIDIQGLLGDRIRTGGSIDTRLQTIQKQLDEWTQRAADKEQALNTQYAQFETELARIKQMGDAVTQLTNMISGSTSSSSSSSGTTTTGG